MTVPEKESRGGESSGLPAVIQQVWWQDGDVHMLPEHGVEHGGRPVDAGRQLQEKQIGGLELAVKVRHCPVGVEQ